MTEQTVFEILRKQSEGATDIRVAADKIDHSTPDSGAAKIPKAYSKWSSFN